MTITTLIAATTTRLRLARVALLVAALLAASAFTSGPVQAAENPPEAAWLAASVRTVAPGDPVSFTVSGFGSGSIVTIALLTPGAVALGTMTAYYDGIGVLTVNVPMATQPGAHSVSANGVDSNGRSLSVSTPLAVAARVAEFTLARAHTGGLAALVTGPAGLITLFGASVLLVGFRKRRAKWAPTT
jgi:hypothetical protein